MLDDENAVLDRAGLESIQAPATLPRIVDEGGQNVFLRLMIDKKDCETRLSPDDLANLLEDGFRAYRRMARE